MDPANLKFPIIKNLTSLSLLTLETFDLGFPNLTPTDLPSLNSIELITPGSISGEPDFFSNYVINSLPRTSWSGVKQLKMELVEGNCDESKHIWFKIWRIFPNLEHFTVKISGYMQKPDHMAQFKELFRNLRKCPWNVSHLTIQVDTTCSFSELMDAMGCGDEDGTDFPSGT